MAIPRHLITLAADIERAERALIEGIKEEVAKVATQKGLDRVHISMCDTEYLKKGKSTKCKAIDELDRFSMDMLNHFELRGTWTKESGWE